MYMHFLRDFYKIFIEPFTSAWRGLVPTPPLIDRVAEDDMINAAERGRGVTVTGSAGAGSTVRLDWNGTSKAVTVDSSGKWSATFSSSEIPKDGHTTISASTINAVGMVSAATSRSVTILEPLFIDGLIDTVSGDNQVSRYEKYAGVTVGGRAEAGSTVELTWGDSLKQVTADSSGKWTVYFAHNEVPADGNYTITATITDQAGNVATSHRAVVVDTVDPAKPRMDTVGGDQYITSAERAAGVVVSGSAEPDGTVRVQWFLKSGDSSPVVTKTVAVDSSGQWSAFFASSELPESLSGEVGVWAGAFDKAGNQGHHSIQPIVVEPLSASDTMANMVIGA